MEQNEKILVTIDGAENSTKLTTEILRSGLNPNSGFIAKHFDLLKRILCIQFTTQNNLRMMRTFHEKLHLKR
ncbi:MAG: hypothetical protein NPIRA01_04060 [Nitrospirales bacterium]|nr:MAG: hypothetical protein NPIRA01_04060 [Nitrospirales bacterium]